MSVLSRYQSAVLKMQRLNIFVIFKGGEKEQTESLKE